MKLNDIINNFVLIEATSLSSTVRIVASEIGNPITQIFDQMESAVYKFYGNNGTTKGMGLILGGIGGRWYHANYSNKLESELHHLAQQSGSKGIELTDFLRHSIKGFGDISDSLPHILAKLGDNIIGADRLARNARAWAKQRSEFLTFMHGFKEVEDDGITRKSKGKGKPTMLNPAAVPSPVAKTTPAAVGQQSAQVDKIISKVLSSLPSGVAGDIRNAIARSDNKMQALIAELNKRGIKV